jgi:hypothetical protein
VWSIPRLWVSTQTIALQNIILVQFNRREKHVFADKSEGEDVSNNQLPDMSTLKGLAAVIIGIILIALAHSIIIHMMLFVSGLLLMYYGFNLLNITGVKTILASIKNYCAKWF